MSKLDMLEGKFDKAVSKASLKNNQEKQAKNIVVYNVPMEWSNLLKENGISFSGYAKLAILEKMKKDGII